tara:strand:+ start:309 stop:731 length:423 start_codon:yes stop_codon:yes gene_type:complete
MPAPAAPALAAIAAALGPTILSALPAIAGKIGGVIGKGIKPGTSKLASDIQFSAPSGEGLGQDPAANVTSGLLDKDFSAPISSLARTGTIAAQLGADAARDLRRARSVPQVRSAVGDAIRRGQDRKRDYNRLMGALGRRG